MRELAITNTSILSVFPTLFYILDLRSFVMAFDPIEINFYESVEVSV